MYSADDIKAMRDAGMTDDDIVGDLRANAPQSFKTDLDAMSKAGMGASDIVSELPHFAAQKPDHMAQMGVVEKGAKALGYGVSQRAGGYEKSAELLHADGTAKFMGDVAKDFAPSDYTPAAEGFNHPKEGDWTIGGKGIGYIPRMALEQAPGMAMDLGALLAAPETGGASLALPAATYGLSTLGNNVEEAARNNGRDLKTASWGDITRGGGVTAAETALNNVGLRGSSLLGKLGLGEGIATAAPKTMGEIAASIPQAAAREGATSAGQDVLHQVGETTGTDKGFHYDPGQTLAAAGTGALTGAVVRGAGAVGDSVQAARFHDMDGNEGVNRQLIDRMDSYGMNPKNEGHAAKMIDRAGRELDTEIGDRASFYKGGDFFKDLAAQDPNAAFGLHESLSKAMDALKGGHEEADALIHPLRDPLGQTKRGQDLLSSIDQRLALNKLNTKGYRDLVGQQVGGIAGRAEWLNPMSMLRSRSLAALGAGTVATGVAGLPYLKQLAFTAGLGAKTIAAPFAAYGAARLLDKATGMRNPTKEFMDRYRGPVTPPAAAPDVDLQRQQWHQDFSQAQAENSDFNLRDTRMFRDARNQNTDFNAQQRSQFRAEDNLFRDARNENANYDSQQRFQNQQVDRQFRDARNENADYEARQRWQNQQDDHAYRDATNEERERNLIADRQYRDAQNVNRNTDLQSDRQFRDARNENADHDQRQNRTYRDAQNENRERDLQSNRQARDAQNENINWNMQQRAAARDTARTLRNAKILQGIKNRTEDATVRDATNENQQRSAAEKQGIDNFKTLQKIKNRTEDDTTRDARNDNAEIDQHLKTAKARMSAIQKVRMMEAKARGDETSEIDPAALQDAIDHPTPIEGTTTAQPKSTASKAKDALDKLNGKTEEGKSKVEYYTYRGYTFPLPDKMHNRGGYLQNLEANQDVIHQAVDHAVGEDGIDPQTGNALMDHIDELHMARNRADAVKVIEKILDKSAKEDKPQVERALTGILHIYSKAKQGD